MERGRFLYGEVLGREVEDKPIRECGLGMEGKPDHVVGLPSLTALELFFRWDDTCSSRTGL